MASVTDWISQSANYMFKEHPELFDSKEDAVGDLIHALDTLREHGGEQGTILFGPYLMYRIVDEGVEEVFFTRKLASVVLFEEESVCRAYGWIDGIELDDPLDDDLDDC